MLSFPETTATVTTLPLVEASCVQGPNFVCQGLHNTSTNRDNLRHVHFHNTQHHDHNDDHDNSNRKDETLDDGDNFSHFLDEFARNFEEMNEKLSKHDNT